MDGILAMAITKERLRSNDNSRSLLFHALSAGTENAVQLSVLNNSTIWQNNVEAVPNEFRVIGKRESQACGRSEKIRLI